MRKTRIFVFLVIIAALSSAAHAQRAEITISLNEQFFDALLDALFQNAAPEFPLSLANSNGDLNLRRSGESMFANASFDAGRPDAVFAQSSSRPLPCSESIRLLRENSGVRTSVRFRDGKIYAPLAFSGSYSPPFIGCVDFAGWAETNIALEFDQDNQRLIARANVLNVSVNGTGGVGGNVMARLVQSSIDKKFNPIEVLRLEKVSFAFPVNNSGTIRMKAVAVRHDIANGVLNVHITYDFLKG